MTFDKHELRLLAVAGGLAAPGQPVKLHWFNPFFARPGQITRLVDKLRAHGFITFDPYAAELRVLWSPVLKLLADGNVTGELFTRERPLDAVLAESSRAEIRDQTLEIKGQPENDLVNRTKNCEMTRAVLLANRLRPEAEAPPPGAETLGIPGVSHESMPMPTPSMPMNRPGKSHVHGPCNSGTSKELHEHGHEEKVQRSEVRGQKSEVHEVGELNGRSTHEILADIRRLAPGLSNEHLEHWEDRIAHEDAALVNRIVREAQLQRRLIRNMPAWLNSAYLKGIRKKELALNP